MRMIDPWFYAGVIIAPTKEARPTLHDVTTQVGTDHFQKI